MSVSFLGRSRGAFWHSPCFSWQLSWEGACIVVLWWKVGASLCVPKQQWSPCQGLALGGLMPAVLGPLVRAWLCN